jgi:hypothetical protein
MRCCAAAARLVPELSALTARAVFRIRAAHPLGAVRSSIRVDLSEAARRAWRPSAADADQHVKQCEAKLEDYTQRVFHAVGSQ